jgi:hypothetical protein
MHVVETIKRYLGWCPHATSPKTRTYAAPEFDNLTKTPAPVGPVIPEPVIGNPEEHRPEYQENILLILLFIGGLFFGLKDFLTFGGFTILCSACVYFDAQNIHAGKKFEKVSLLGEVASWQPITWAAAAFVGSFIGIAIYLFCRQEIFNANN